MCTLRQYAVSTAYRRSHFDALAAVGELKQHGNYGLGELTALAGELIVDGRDFYVADAAGNVRPAQDDDTVCFAQITCAPSAREFKAPPSLTLDSAGEAFRPLFKSRNRLYLITLHGNFEYVTTTVYPPQKKPYPSLADANKQAANFTFKRESGDIIGFYTPAFLRDVGVPGFHFHFLNDRRTGGGHVTSFLLRNGRGMLQAIDNFSLAIPNNREFLEGDLGPA